MANNVNNNIRYHVRFLANLYKVMSKAKVTTSFLCQRHQDLLGYHIF